MSVMTSRGGAPKVVRVGIDTTGREIRFPFFLNYLVARNKGAAIVRLYFTEDDFTNDANYVELPVAADSAPHGEWAGPVETGGDGRENLWLKSTSGTVNVELVGFQRRG